MIIIACIICLCMLILWLVVFNIKMEVIDRNKLTPKERSILKEYVPVE